jgi:hypothetical protein
MSQRGSSPTREGGLVINRRAVEGLIHKTKKICQQIWKKLFKRKSES